MDGASLVTEGSGYPRQRSCEQSGFVPVSHDTVESIESVERPTARGVRLVVVTRRVPDRRLAMLVRGDSVGSDEVVNVVAMQGATVGELVVSELVAVLGEKPPLAPHGAPAFAKDDLDEPRPATHRRVDREIHEHLVAVAIP